MEIRDRLNALIEILEVELFVGAMEVVAVEAETHENDLDPQHLLE